MRLNLKKIPYPIVFFFILTQVFAFSLSFVDLLYTEGMWQQRLIDGIYMARNISFVVSIAVIVLGLHITIDDILLLLSGFVAYLLMCAFFQENLEYFQAIQPLMKYIYVGYIAVRANLFSFNALKTGLIWAARVVCCAVLALLLSNQSFLNVGKIYMSFANGLEMAAALLVYSSIIDGKKLDLVLVGFCLVALLFYGSRGAILILAILAAYLVWIKYKSPKFVIAILFAAGFLVIFGPSLLSGVLVKLVDTGLSSRTLEKMISGSFFSSSDRSQIYQYLFEALLQHPMMGVGICGDRYYLPMRFTGVDATYAHNLIIEMFLDFGIPMGSAVLAAICYFLYTCFLKEQDLGKKGLFAVFVVSGFIHLMFSRSWLTEQNFFILFALLLTYSESKRVHLTFKIR